MCIKHFITYTCGCTRFSRFAPCENHAACNNSRLAPEPEQALWAISSSVFCCRDCSELLKSQTQVTQQEETRVQQLDRKLEAAKQLAQELELEKELEDVETRIEGLQQEKELNAAVRRAKRMKHEKKMGRIQDKEISDLERTLEKMERVLRGEGTEAG